MININFYNPNERLVLKLNKSIKFLIFSLMIISLSMMHAEQSPINIDSAKYPELYKFVIKHRCSPEIENAIQSEAKNIELVKRRHYNNPIFKYKNSPLMMLCLLIF